MMHRAKVLAIATLIGAGVACQSGRHSSAGFHLPADGNAERGKQAFLALGCNSCHEVAGADLPRPADRPTPALFLGGEVPQRLSDAYLVTAMIYPAYQLAPYPKDQTISHGISRMPSYADSMSVREMVDLVAFLQSHYQERQTPQMYVR